MIQKQEYLKNVPIQYGTIPNIGPGLSTTLISFGIDSAFDAIEADRVGMKVPQFGDVRWGHVMTWARSVERKFKYDPTKSVAENDLRMLVTRYEQQRIQLEGRIRQCRDELKQRTLQAEAKALSLQEDLLKAEQQAAQCVADCQLMAA